MIQRSLQLDPIDFALEKIGVNMHQFRNASFDSFDGSIDGVALAECRKFVSDFLNGKAPSLYLYSSRAEEPIAPGCGKTHLTVSICRALLETKPELVTRIRFACAAELVDDFRAASRSYENRDAAEWKYFPPALLVIDDLGSERLNEFAVEKLNYLVYKREGRPTIYTSNFGLEELEGRDPTGMFSRAISRIAGSSVIVCLSGPDRRLLHAEALRTLRNRNT